MSIRILACVVALAAAGCATETPSINPNDRAQPPGVSPLDVSMGFIASVVDACVPAVERGIPIGDVAGASEFASVTDASGRQFAGAKPEDKVWSPKRGGGIVFIRQTTTDCVVSAYGAPVAVTFDGISAVLTQKQGFGSNETTAAMRSGQIVRVHRKTAGDRALTVSFSGSEPGTPGTLSRFSTLVATISFQAPRN